MKKNKLSGKGAAQCQAVDWTEFAQNLDSQGNPKKKKVESGWDVDDGGEEAWPDEIPAKKRKAEAVQAEVANEVTGDAGEDDLSDSIVVETLNQIARDGVLRADGAFVTGEIDAREVSAQVAADESRKAAGQAVNKAQNQTVETSRNKAQGQTPSQASKKPVTQGQKQTAVQQAGQKTAKKPVQVTNEASTPKSGATATKKARPDEDAIRKSVDEKIIVRSEELKAKRGDKNSKKVKVRVKKGEAANGGADSGITFKDKKGLSKYKNMGVLPTKTNGPSDFRKESANWRYDGVAKAATSDEQIEKAVEEESFADKIKKFTPVQYISVALAVVLLVMGVLNTAVYADYRSGINRKEAFAMLPKFADAERISSDSDYLSEDMFMEEAAAELSENTGKVLSLVLTSVEKDLKIKLVDEEDTLVKDLKWGVAITDSDGDESEYEDEDVDGIIHITDIKAGDYSVSILPSDDLAGYEFPSIGQEVSVKAKVEYKVIANIKEEIKKESEVNVALEDPNGNKAADVETGEALSDTVNWVESTEQAIEGSDEYEEAEVDLSKTEKLVALIDRVKDTLTGLVKGINRNYTGKYTVASLFGGVRRVAVEGEEGNTPSDNQSDGSSSDSSSSSSSQDVQSNGDGSGNSSSSSSSSSSSEGQTQTEVTGASIDRSTASIVVGSTLKLNISMSPQGATPSSCRWESTNPMVAAVSDGTVTALSTGTAKVGAIINNSIIVYCDVTVTSKDEVSIAVAGATSVAVGETTTLTATCNPTSDTVTEWSSDDTSIATVAADGYNGVVKGVKEGTVKIRAVSSSGAQTEFEITVTSGNAQYSDDAQLYDSSKNKLYVLDGTTYRLAKYSDYKSGKFTKYYRKISDVVYTGWQTIDGVTYYFTENHEKVTGDQVIGGVTYHFGSDGALAQGSGILGIDVSKYQPSINWSSVKASGVNYVIIRCGYRGASTGSLIQDPYFVSHIKGAKEAGLKVGVYFFSTALNETEAVEEASMCAELCSGYGINYPVFIDVESSSRAGYNGLSVEQRTANIRAFCQTIQSAGYTPGLYANKTWLTSYINTSSLSCKIWLAQYNSAGPTYTGHYDIWQYTSKGKVDGISGNVDMNQSYLGY